MTALRIGFAGMTHLGLNSAVAAAARGADIICFDLDETHIASLSCGEIAIKEPGLTELLEKHQSHIAFTARIEALASCDLVIIAPDVPTDDAGNSDLSALHNLIAKVDDVLPLAMVFVVLSQVPPGFCRALKVRLDRKFYYQVETLIFGRAIERALNPERTIIGCANPAEEIPAAYQGYLDLFDCPILPMKFESAELAKIAINCCLVSSISVANSLAELCENIGADWSEIVPSLKLDKRIGQHAYLSPGLGIAGGNLERDLNTVLGFSRRHGTDAGVVEAWLKNSRYRKDWVLRLLHERVFPQTPQPQIAVWGLAYKQDTHSIKNSPSIALIEHLGDNIVTVYDPVVTAEAVPNKSVLQAADALSACEGADVLIVMTPWAEFAEIDIAEVSARMSGTVIIDPYLALDVTQCKALGLKHFTLGRQPEL